MAAGLYRGGGVLAVLAALAFVCGCAHSPPSDPWDPIEPVNRAVFKFNNTADDYVLRPVAKGYDRIAPTRVQHSVANFFANLGEPITLANSLLQGKFGAFSQALGRLMINTSVGLGGLFDVAGALGVPDPDEDLGQTLGVYGLGAGPYLVLPVVGPTSGRDFAGVLGDQFADPLGYATQIQGVDNSRARLVYLLRGLDIVNERAGLLGQKKRLEQQFDPYAFLRTYYLQKRRNAVADHAGQALP